MVEGWCVFVAAAFFAPALQVLAFFDRLDGGVADSEGDGSLGGIAVGDLEGFIAGDVSIDNGAPVSLGWFRKLSSSLRKGILISLRDTSNSAIILDAWSFPLSSNIFLAVSRAAMRSSVQSLLGSTNSSLRAIASMSLEILGLSPQVIPRSRAIFWRACLSCSCKESVMALPVRVMASVRIL